MIAAATSKVTRVHTIANEESHANSHSNHRLEGIDKLDIDLLSAATDKLDQNADRYPADRVRGSAKKYTEY